MARIAGLLEAVSSGPGEDREGSPPDCQIGSRADLDPQEERGIQAAEMEVSKVSPWRRAEGSGMGTKKTRCNHKRARLNIPEGDILVCAKCNRVVLPKGMTGDDLGLDQLRVLVKMLEV